MAQCLDCRYGLPAHMTRDDAIVLECHRYPPHVQAIATGDPDDDGLVRLWPQVDTDDWCGEYRRVEAVG